MDVKYLIVHCSATKRKMDIGAKEIDRWHRQQGWLGIGYHYVIRRDGMIEEGRSELKRGAHCVGWNHCSLGICLVGGIDDNGKPENNFTEMQMRRLRALLQTMLVSYPGATIVGHRDMPNVHKDCPCFDVQEWWEGYADESE